MAADKTDTSNPLNIIELALSYYYDNLMTTTFAIVISGYSKISEYIIDKVFT